MVSEYTGGLDPWDDSTMLSIRKKTAYGNFLCMQVSDMSWELVAKDGSIQADSVTIFKDASGEVYMEDPIQAIDSLYYGNDDLTNDDIVATFSDLVVNSTDEQWSRGRYTTKNKCV